MIIPYGKQEVTDADKEAVMEVLDADFLTQTLDAILCQDFVTARLRK